MPRLCLTIVFNIRFLLQFFSLSNFRFCPKQFHPCVTKNTNWGLGRPSATFYTLMPLNVLFQQQSQNVLEEIWSKVCLINISLEYWQICWVCVASWRYSLYFPNCVSISSHLILFSLRQQTGIQSDKILILKH